jgi:hypothetical protein
MVPILRVTEQRLKKASGSKRNLIKEVIVNGDEVLLRNPMPISPKGNTEEKVLVLSFEYDGGPYCSISRTFSLSFKLV